MNHKICIVAIFKNEQKFIKEWIEYHLKVGVDHFYLYDNGGDHWSLIEPFEEKITYQKWTDDLAEEYTKTQSQKLSRQTGAYTHCIQNFGSETHWLQLLDLDEFMVPLASNSVKESIDERAGVLRIPRINFGNSGNWVGDRCEASISCYDRRERKPSHYKDMGHSASIKKVKGPHTLIVDGKVNISTAIRIDHHYTRSLQEWLERAKTGGGQKGMGFRVYIGKRKWLAYLTYVLLNVRSLHLLVFAVGFNSAILLLTNTSQLLYLINIPIIIWIGFAYFRGQNEIKDTRLQELNAI